MRVSIGIDPGLTGAIAAVDDQAQLVICADLPLIRSGKLEWIDANALTDLLLQSVNGRPTRISRPPRSIASRITIAPRRCCSPCTA